MSIPERPEVRPPAEPLDPLRRWRLAGVVATAAIVLSVPLHLGVRALRGPRATPALDALYVGSERCRACHQPSYDKWKRSNHGLAMQAARPDTVLGDFADASFELRGRRWRFFREGERFLVEAEGPDDCLQQFEVAYTFGLAPLQQYLVPFPGGRLQCLSVAWDTVGKRWFFLYPGQDIPPTDWLHWTRQAQNWNTMCSDCHSTGVRKRYDPETDTFETTWSEIMVGCEACHGPGSLHVAWAEQPAMARPELPGFALVKTTSDLSNRELVALCAPCHSRRAQLADLERPGGELLEHYLPVLLAPGVFHPDGQILEEDYEYHSFVQSKMYANNVACRDCHDVHSAKRHAQGNELCTRCHRADTYDTDHHHFHKRVVDGNVSPGALCTSCHMPGQDYMVVHFRRDHSLRVPRPDLSAEIGTPNACNAAGCHADRSVAWAVQAADRWYGQKRKPHYGPVIAAGREGRAEAGPELIALGLDPLRPAMVRATALDLLRRYPGEESTRALEQALSDEDAIIRRTAAGVLPTTDPARAVRTLGPLLSDPVRGVRMTAAARLVEVAPAQLPDARRQAFQAALDEYVAGQRYASDMPSGPYNLGNLFLALGRLADAAAQYRRAVAVDDQFYPATVNLAMVLAQQGRNDEALELLSQVHRAWPDLAAASFNLGLLLADLGRAAEAEAALRDALAAEPDLAAAAYNLAVLVAPSRPVEALSLCRQAARLEPEEPRYAWSQAFFEHQVGDEAAASHTLEALLARFPAHGDAVLLLGEIYERQGDRAEALALFRRALDTPGLADSSRAVLSSRLAGTPTDRPARERR